MVKTSSGVLRKNFKKKLETDEEERNDETSLETSESAGTNETDNSVDEKKTKLKIGLQMTMRQMSLEETEDVEELRRRKYRRVMMFRTSN